MPGRAGPVWHEPTEIAALALLLCRGGGGSASSVSGRERADECWGLVRAVLVAGRPRVRVKGGRRVDVPRLWLQGCPAVRTIRSGAGLQCSDSQG